MSMPGRIYRPAGDRPGALRWLTSLPERYARPPTANYNPQLDGLRAVAILLVLFWHGSLRIVRYSDTLIASGHQVRDVYPWLPHGEIGVGLFFVISGFIIAQPFLAKPYRRWDIGSFYRRRLQRLYPPYIVALLICFVPLSLGLFRDRNVYDIPLLGSLLSSSVYLHGMVYDHPSRLNPPTWSLEVEVQFYLVAPLLVAAMALPRAYTHRAMLAASLAVASLLAAGYVHGAMPFDGRFRFGFLAHAHLFIAGIALADLARQTAFDRMRGSAWADLCFWSGCAALIGLGVVMTGFDANMPGFLPHALMDVAALAAVLSVFCGAMLGPIASRVLSGPWLRLVGTMCYSIYLVHIVIVEASGTMLSRLNLQHTSSIWLVWWAVLVVAVGPPSFLFYVWVERPFMNRAPLGSVSVARALGIGGKRLWKHRRWRGTAPR